MGRYTKTLTLLYNRDTYYTAFIAALFTTVKKNNQTRYPLMDERVKNMYIHSGILFFYGKNEMLSFAITWLEMEDVMLK